ncbi:MAG: hypothetical protein IPG89_14820 [Bacteroidetes bacterium]|nr:hypothetical protein [Bacteroidota bacterium]
MALTTLLQGVSLENRKLLSMCEIKDSKEEGIVVVKIKVNKAGQVIDADPNQRGTNTSSSVLKEKLKAVRFKIRILSVYFSYKQLSFFQIFLSKITSFFRQFSTNC